MHSDPTLYLANILVIDKDAANLKVVHKHLREEGFEKIQSACDLGDVAIGTPQSSPDLVLLDVQGQSLGPFELISLLKSNAVSDELIPSIVFMGYGDQVLREDLIAIGAFDFVPKPVTQFELCLRVRNALSVRLLSQRLGDLSGDLEEKIAERTKSLYDDQVEMLQRLARASEYRDDDTGDHTKRVGVMSAKIALEMGLPEDTVDLIRLAAPLHDIGKIGIRDAILMKPGKLTESEFVVMRTHAIIGSRILEGRSKLLQMAEVIARTHHEKWDGTGYPSRLSGENIPLPGRIVAVADVFDALISERAYKVAWPLSRAIEEIKSLSGRHFDPKVVAAFLNVIASESESLKAA